METEKITSDRCVPCVKKCAHCGNYKHPDEFHNSLKASDGKASWCKECTKGIKRPKRKRTYSPAVKRKWQLKTLYGLTPALVDSMLQQQKNQCAICSAPLNKFHVDHCHNTGKVRGLLCHRCNIRLGGWDDIAWRDRAINYLGLNVDAPLLEAA